MLKKQNAGCIRCDKQIELLAKTEETYERAEQQASALLDQGFHLGGVIPSTRDEWHER